jgi:hypothetical protein
MLNVEWASRRDTSRSTKGFIQHSTLNIQHSTLAFDSARHVRQTGEKQ